MGSARMGPLIFSMALPAMISMLINALYNIVDSIFVAQYSPERAGRGFRWFFPCSNWLLRSAWERAWASTH